MINISPSMDPCETPYNIESGSEKLSFILTKKER